MEVARGGALSFTLKDTEMADAALADLVAASGATTLDDVSVAHHCAQVSLPGGQLDHGGSDRETLACLASAAKAGADILVSPCVLCYSALNRYQRTLDPRDPVRRVSVLHLVQLLGAACASTPTHVGLRHSTSSAQQILPFG
jgi:heterodisulfide reductase subunit B